MALDNSLVNRNWMGRGGAPGGFREPPPANADSYGGWGAQANPALVANQDEASQRTGNTEGTGTLTHYRPVAHPGADGAMTTWAAQPGGGGRAPAAGVGGPPGFKDPSLGEPTSYEGGAGAPTPIENMGKGFVNPSGGPAYATPQMAGQAANREAGVGTWRAPGQTLEEIKAKAHVEGSKAAAQNSYYDAMGRKVDAETGALKATNLKTETNNNLAAGRGRLEEEVGLPNEKGNNLSLPTEPGFQAILKKMNNLITQRVPPDEAYKAIAPELHKHFYTPENISGAITLYQKQSGKAVSPQVIMDLQSGKPEAMQTLYPWIQEFRRQPKSWYSGVLSENKPVAPVAPGPQQTATSSTNDPALQNLQTVGRAFQGIAETVGQGVRNLNRGARQVIPGVSSLYDEKGNWNPQNPFK